MTYQEKLRDPKLTGKSGIYKLVINEQIYVGSSILLTKRLGDHFKDLKANKHCNIHLQRAYNKHKLIDFFIIEFIDNNDLLINREQYYIDSLKPRYNIAPTAGSQLGFKHSAATRLLISQQQTGRKHSIESVELRAKCLRGKKLSIEHVQKISKAKMGDKNPFYKAGVRHPQYGTHRSEATIIKLSKDNNWAARTGVLYDVETGNNYVFRSLRSVCKSLGLTYRSVLGALRKERFYMDRFYASFIHVPVGKETIINQPLQFVKKISGSKNN